MCKIPDKVIQFIEKTMQTWRVELTAGRKRLTEVKIQRCIFQGEAVSPLLFVIAMMSLNHILGKCTDEYQLSRSQKEINHLMYMDDIKRFAKNERELETLNTDRENIQSRYRNGVLHREMRRTSNEKWETTHDRRNRTTKSRKKLKHSEKRKPINTWGYWKLTLSNKWRWKKKFKKQSISRKPASYSRQNYIAGTLSKE